MNHLTETEHNKIHEITKRLSMITSPVLRLQAILQYSQIVDILTLGDTAQESQQRYMNEITELEDIVNEYHEKYPAHD
jgi:hypothetical protein